MKRFLLGVFIPFCVANSEIIAQNNVFSRAGRSNGNTTTITPSTRNSATSNNISYQGNSSSSNTNRQSGNVAYLDIFNRYSSYDKTPKIERPIVKSEKIAWTNNKGFRYLFYYDNGWIKTLSIGTCPWCSGRGRGGISFNMFAGNSECGNCQGSGTRVEIFSSNNSAGVGYLSNGDIYTFQGTSGGGSVGGNSVSGGFSGSSSGGSSGSSVYTKCTTCNGTGVCTGCGGRRGEWRDTGYYTGNNTKTWIDCGSCRGSGRCGVCYGRGKL